MSKSNDDLLFIASTVKEAWDPPLNSGALHHVTARGNAQNDIYRDDVDGQQFLTRPMVTSR